VAARYYTVSWVGERVTADLRNAVYARVLAQSPQFFETLQTGEVLSRLTGDTTLMQTVVGSSISMGLRSLFQFIGGMVMLAVTSFTCSAQPRADGAAALPIVAIGRKVRRNSRANRRTASPMPRRWPARSSTPCRRCRPIRRRNRRPAGSPRAPRLSFATGIRRTRVRAALTGLIIAAVMGTIIFVLWIGARQVHAGALTGGELAPSSSTPPWSPAAPARWPRCGAT
jgi:ATP-binding cassette subfamily B protein